MEQSRRSVSTLVLVLLGVLTLGVLGLLLLRPDPAPSVRTQETSVRSHTYAADDRVSVSVYGESISAADSTDFGGQDVGGRSWVAHMDNTKVRFVGGYARGGLTTDEALGRLVPGLRTDVYVIELGTNDLGAGLKRKESPEKLARGTTRNLDALAKQLQPEPAGRMVVVSVGPVDTFPASALETFDAIVGSHVEERGWTYADPWPALASDDDRWRWQTSLTRDGFHPNAKGASILGETLQAEILRAAR